jgi:hypothetical protein
MVLLTSFRFTFQIITLHSFKILLFESQPFPVLAPTQLYQYATILSFCLSLEDTFSFSKGVVLRECPFKIRCALLVRGLPHKFQNGKSKKAVFFLDELQSEDLKIRFLFPSSPSTDTQKLQFTHQSINYLQ